MIFKFLKQLLKTIQVFQSGAGLFPGVFATSYSKICVAFLLHKKGPVRSHVYLIQGLLTQSILEKLSSATASPSATVITAPFELPLWSWLSTLQVLYLPLYSLRNL
ncbi:hypothetical protein Gasu2_40870 [Galdieria sulphuraria]|nr:hypothetical protein Gasu2_40870 [Galdieria sulphuraria]